MPQPTTTTTTKKVAVKKAASTIAQRTGPLPRDEIHKIGVNVLFEPHQIAVIDELRRLLGGLQRSQLIRVALAELAERKGLSFG